MMANLTLIALNTNVNEPTAPILQLKKNGRLNKNKVNSYDVCKRHIYKIKIQILILRRQKKIECEHINQKKSGVAILANVQILKQKVLIKNVTLL